MTPELHDRIIARLLDSGAVDHPWSDLIVAALEGEERLRAHLDGHPVAKPSPPAGPTGPKFVEPPGAYVHPSPSRFPGRRASCHLAAAPGARPHTA